MTDKEQWLEFWNLSGEEGERQWQAKQEMHARPPKVNYVIPDIGGYQSQATGEWISSRSAHREHLRKNGLIEIGTDTKAALTKQAPKDDKEGRRRSIAEAMNATGF